MSTADPALDPLPSRLSSDPDMIELITFFLDHLDEQVGVIRTAWQERDLATLRTTSHQLRGSGSAYGYPEITDVAGAVETALAVEADIAALGERIEALIRTCRRAGMARPMSDGA
jgi:HPt (histidine-containing phosphotransfer) domain-containing protein